MINIEEVIYKAKVNGYYFYYDGTFISIFDEDISINKNAQCILRNRAECFSKKDFEMEVTYANHKLGEFQLD